MCRGLNAIGGTVGVSRSATGERSAESGRRLLRRRGARLSPAQALFRRLFVFNGLVFTVGTLVLALSPPRSPRRCC